MDSINSWINEDEVRKLAEDLTASPEAVEEWESNASEGFTIPEKQGEGSSKEDAKANSSEEKDLSQEMKKMRSVSLAGASAMAASAGLLGKNNSTKSAEPEASELSALCDHCLNEVPVNIDENTKVPIPSVHPKKEMGTFEQIDKQLSKRFKANGICVIDRDGDVLFSSVKNYNLVAFSIDTILGSNLIKTEDGEFENIRVKISAGEYLEFISVRSTRGVLVLAISVDHILGRANAKDVAGDVLKIANLV
jgi:hypothetical protein